MAKRKLGQLDHAEEKACQPKRRKRLKTFQMLHFVDNMLRQSAGMQLSTFKPPRDEATGELVGCPFDWPRLSLAPDAGPDMTAADHFMSYQLGLNVDVSYDVSHWLQNCSKQSLRMSTVKAAASHPPPQFGYSRGSGWTRPRTSPSLQVGRAAGPKRPESFLQPYAP